MPAYLCIDGGGTKTSAWIAVRDEAGTRMAHGVAGSGNL